jgi:hypothetical protein
MNSSEALSAYHREVYKILGLKPKSMNTEPDPDLASGYDAHMDKLKRQRERYHKIRKHGEYDYFNYTPEQIELNNKLKERDKPSIIPDKDFHELFCKVLKEETDRECDCEGTTSEIR